MENIDSLLCVPKVSDWTYPEYFGWDLCSAPSAVAFGGALPLLRPDGAWVECDLWRQRAPDSSSQNLSFHFPIGKWAENENRYCRSIKVGFTVTDTWNWFHYLLLFPHFFAGLIEHAFLHFQKSLALVQVWSNPPKLGSEIFGLTVKTNTMPIPFAAWRTMENGWQTDVLTLTPDKLWRLISQRRLKYLSTVFRRCAESSLCCLSLSISSSNDRLSVWTRFRSFSKFWYQNHITCK